VREERSVNLNRGRLQTLNKGGLQSEAFFNGIYSAAPLSRHGADFATLLVLGLCIFSYIKTNVVAPIPGLPNQSDFGVYYCAAKDVVAGKSPYENPAYFYPPLVSFLMTPFAFTDYVTGRWIWFLLSHVVLLLAGWLLWRAGNYSRIGLCCIACVWTYGGALKETLDVGQINVLLVLVLAAAYTSRSKFQAAGIGMGFALKYIPGILVAALILQRRWRALLAFIGTAIAAFLPWAAIMWTLDGAKVPPSARYWMGTPSIYSWSIPSMVLRVLSPLKRGAVLPHAWEYGNVAADLHLSPTSQWISVGAALVILVTGMLLLVFRCRGRLSADQLPWAMIALVSLSLAAAPVCWSHYQVLQYPGVALMLARSIRQRSWFITAAVASSFLLSYQFPEAALKHYHDAYSGWTAASPFTLYVWTSAAPFACLALFALALSQIKRTPNLPRRPIIEIVRLRRGKNPGSICNASGSAYSNPARWTPGPASSRHSFARRFGVSFGHRFANVLARRLVEILRYLDIGCSDHSNSRLVRDCKPALRTPCSISLLAP